MKKSKKNELLKDALFGRPFDNNVDMRGVVCFVAIVAILAVLVLGLTFCKLL